MRKTTCAKIILQYLKHFFICVWTCRGGGNSVSGNGDGIVEERNGKLHVPPCVRCQESDNGSLSSPRVVLDLMVLSISSGSNHGRWR